MAKMIPRHLVRYRIVIQTEDMRFIVKILLAKVYNSILQNSFLLPNDSYMDSILFASNCKS
jgi:hypothetical protein